jgi:hypothetical protein
MSIRVAAQGTATPLTRPNLRGPVEGATINAPTNFQWTSVRGPVASVLIGYVVQISPDPSFPAGRTTTLPEFVESVVANGQTVSSPTFDTGTLFPGSTTLYWRVGARNVADRPGPVADASGNRYIFSSPRRFNR